MTDDIQPVYVGTGVGIATEAVKRSADDKIGAFVLHPVGQHWIVVWNETDYRAILDARCLSAMFSDKRNKAMFDRRGSRQDTDIGAWERR